MPSKAYLMLRAPRGRVSKHARPQCSQFFHKLLRREDGECHSDSEARCAGSSWPTKLLHVSDELQDFYRAGAELLRQLVLQRFRLLDKARFIDILDELNTDLFQSRH